jgi:hypothetical protein
VLPPGTPEPRVRMVAFVVYLALWIAVRALFTQLFPVRGG